MEEKDLVKIIQVKESVFEDNNADAARFREELKAKKTFLFNIMSSPGSGKTTTLCRIIETLKDEYSIGVLEADIDGDVDAYTVRNAGAKAIQIHTGGMCHLDADMTRQGFNEFEGEVDIAFLENVGNLVCPAEYDTGAHKNIAILSIPEGDDKPVKYPLLFECVDAVIINKIDTISYFDFDLDKCRKEIEAMNPKAKFFTISAIRNEGIKEVCEWIKNEYKNWSEK